MKHFKILTWPNWASYFLLAFTFWEGGNSDAVEQRKIGGNCNEGTRFLPYKKFNSLYVDWALDKSEEERENGFKFGVSLFRVLNGQEPMSAVVRGH